jgi:quercetin dioxygenase-like cupin family protein
MRANATRVSVAAASMLILLAHARVVADPARPTQALPAGFVEVHADRVPWQSHPAIRGAEFAILLGKPAEAGPLIVRVKLPPNVQVMPHTHPEVRTYTVLSGEWKLGFGGKYDAAVLLSYSAGSMYRLPAKVPHFQAAGASGAIVQIESMGPTSTDFINADDDPRGDRGWGLLTGASIGCSPL